MKKYNLSKIMKRAWEMVKKAGMVMSAALKQAWAEAKAAVAKKKFEGFAKVAKTENVSDESSYLYFKGWKKGDKDRVYVNDYKRRTIGFFEKGEFTLIDNQGNFKSEVQMALDGFKAAYIF